MKGTILDFLQLAEEKPGLAKELVELAARYGFEFTPYELSDAEAQAVTGGALGGIVPTAGMGTPIPMQSPMPSQQASMQTLSSISSMLHRTSMSIIRKIG